MAILVILVDLGRDIDVRRTMGPAAVANAMYDATGVRVRRVPFRDARVLAALTAAGV